MSRYRDDDPPDEPEPPECCGEPMEFTSGSPAGCVVTCQVCLRSEEIVYTDYPEPATDPVEELPADFYKGPPMCPHGSPWEACDTCDYLGDLAYDAAK
jgi:hypothetical protein